MQPTQNQPQGRHPAELQRPYLFSHTCKECGVIENGKWARDVEERLARLNLCHACGFWTNLLGQDSVRIGGEHYTIGDGKGQFRGHSGRAFLIRFLDGREVVTCDLWCQGKIPQHFKSRLPDNAEFIPVERNVEVPKCFGERINGVEGRK